MLVVLANQEERDPMPVPTPKLLTTPSPPVLKKPDRYARNEARLTAIVEAAYILEAIRR
jgi:hypothetical protein